MYHDAQGREIEDLEMDNMERDHQENLKLMQQWELDAIEAALDNDMAVDVSNDGNMFHVQSALYGTSRYHVVGKEYHGVTIDQIDDTAGYARITIYADEVPALLKILLEWQFDQAREKIEAQINPELRDLDNHPF